MNQILIGDYFKDGVIQSIMDLLDTRNDIRVGTRAGLAAGGYIELLCLSDAALSAAEAFMSERGLKHYRKPFEHPGENVTEPDYQIDIRIQRQAVLRHSRELAMTLGVDKTVIRDAILGALPDAQRSQLSE